MPERTAKPRRSADRVELAYLALRELVGRGALLPGERINEVELAGRLLVSRTPLREALNRMVSEGFLDFVPNRGFFRRALDPVEMLELYEIRAALERAAFVLACARAVAEEIAALATRWRAAVCESASLGVAALAREDEAFHRALVRLSGNGELLKVHESVSARLRFLRLIDIEQAERRATTFEEHDAIIAALERREAEAGAALLERHITLSQAQALAVVREGEARLAPQLKTRARKARASGGAG